MRICGWVACPNEISGDVMVTYRLQATVPIVRAIDDAPEAGSRERGR